MDFNDLTPEQQEKAKACNTPDDLLAFAKEEGVELTDEELEAISGGSWDNCEDQTCGKHHFCRGFR